MNLSDRPRIATLLIGKRIPAGSLAVLRIQKNHVVLFCYNRSPIHVTAKRQSGVDLQVWN